MSNYWLVSVVIFGIGLLLNLSMFHMYKELAAEYRKVLGDIPWYANYADWRFITVTILCAGINASIPYLRWVYLGSALIFGGIFAFSKVRASYIRFCFKPVYEL